MVALLIVMAFLDEQCLASYDDIPMQITIIPFALMQMSYDS